MGIQWMFYEIRLDFWLSLGILVLSFRGFSFLPLNLHLEAAISQDSQLDCILIFLLLILLFFWLQFQYHNSLLQLFTVKVDYLFILHAIVLFHSSFVSDKSSNILSKPCILVKLNIIYYFSRQCLIEDGFKFELVLEECASVTIYMSGSAFVTCYLFFIHWSLSYYKYNAQLNLFKF